MSRQNRVRKLIDLDIKKEIISKWEGGKSVDLSAEYGMAKSMISTILKNNEEIKCGQVTKGISRLSSSHCNITEQMEILQKGGQMPSNWWASHRTVTQDEYEQWLLSLCDFLWFLLGKVCLYFHWGRLFMLFMCVRFFMLLLWKVRL